MAGSPEGVLLIYTRDNMDSRQTRRHTETRVKPPFNLNGDYSHSIVAAYLTYPTNQLVTARAPPCAPLSNMRVEIRLKIVSRPSCIKSAVLA